MLQTQGHTVSGVSLDPPEESLFNQADLASIFKNDLRVDIRNSNELKNSFEKISPDVVIHLAAQPLVRESYRIAVETFEVNVIGTLNVLEATKELKNLKAALIITTDKVYKNHNHLRGYVETDELGGDDPYSASKAAADIATQSWIKSFANVPMAIARAGNVIGGGDWAQDRLVPDLISAYASGNIPTLRYPKAIRPWQHVLDCLNGYLTLVNKQIDEGLGGEWNFGPKLIQTNSVGDMAKKVAESYGLSGSAWNLETQLQPHESGYLLLDSSKSEIELGWSEKLDFSEAVLWTVDWFQSLELTSPREATQMQIERFFSINLAKN